MMEPPPLPEPVARPRRFVEPSGEPVISVADVSRTFGNVEAVRGISFEIYPGQVVGFIGANGAGKTTTMRIMATLDLPTRGAIRIAGLDVVNFPTEVRRKVGWMPDAYGTYSYMTVFEYLDFYGRAFGFARKERARRVEEVMEFADLKPIADRMMDKLSKGMAQRLCLGRTLLHDPDVLILDEPAAGLDPKARIEFKHLVRLLAEEGKTIFISSHILTELAEMCDTLLFIDEGRIVHHGSAESLVVASDAEAIVDVRVCGSPEALTTWAAMNPGVSVIEPTHHGARVSFAKGDSESLTVQLRKMVHDGVPVVDFHRESRKLEDAFVDMLRKIQP